jgi:hypothetical protein
MFRTLLAWSLTLTFLAAFVPAGTAQTLSLTPTTLRFANVVEFTSSTKTVTAKNKGTTPLTLTSIAGSPADYAVTNNCPVSPATLAAGASCTITVVFTPTSIGTDNGTLTVTSNATGSPQSVALTGTGLAPVTLSSTTYNYGTLLIATPSAPKTFTLTNNLSTALSVSSVTTNQADFQVTSNLCGTVSGGGTCTVTVVFTPSTVNTENATLSFFDNATTSPQTIALTGKGTKKGISTISVTPVSVGVLAGQAQQFTATANLTAGGTLDLTKDVTWSSTNPAAATITSIGLATAGSSGTSTIKATLSTLSAAASLSVATLTSISVTPGTATVPQGLTQSYTATGTYSNGAQQLLAGVTWSSSNAAVASVTSSGMASALAQGTANVSASVGSISGSAQLTVTSPILTSITVAPNAIWVGVGSNKQFTATGTFTDSSTQDITQSVTWSSSNASLGTVDSYGLATSTGAGAATITAYSAGITGSGTLNGVSGGFVSCDARPVDMKILVVTNGQTEADFPAITQALDYLGTPYTIFDITTGGTMTSDYLYSGCHGFYQGVIFTFGGWIYSLSGNTNLYAYESQFSIRQVNWFDYPDPNFGLNSPNNSISASSTPYNATYTSDGASVFSYANAANPLGITNAEIYLSTPVAGADPLLADSSGNALAVVYNTSFAYQYLTLTFDSNPYLTHDLVLAYGLINWVTQGVYLGERHAYLSPQIDDFFITDSEWTPGLACSTGADNTGTVIRSTGTDLTQLLSWQTAKQAQSTSPGFILAFAFNGSGAVPGAFDPDTLTPQAMVDQALFLWVNHTWDHTNLNNLDYTTSASEITQNNAEAITLGLTNYNIKNMVTPDISGLTNPNFLQAAVDNGVNYLVTDTSVTGEGNPTPNTGIVNTIQGSIYMVPRHPNNLFFNAATPDGWVAEYTCIYPQLGYDYNGVIGNISASFVQNMLVGDIDPEMFHTANLFSYDGTHSLLSDLLDATFTQYNSLMTLPVLSLAEDAIAAKMIARATYNGAGVSGTIIPHSRVMITASQDATVPVSGLSSTGAEIYGGQPISYLSVTGGQTVTMPVQ